jgi:DNA segregation ATPase FtsK/SpoIIIE, S-DNA-T family
MNLKKHGSTLALLLLLLALASHQLGDPAWSTSGQHDKAGMQLVTRNWLGGLGAYTADILFYFWGRSIGLLPLAGLVYLWLPARRPNRSSALRSGFLPLALLGLLLVAAAVEWLVGSRWDAALPSQAGGVVGSSLGAFVLSKMPWFGEHQATLVLLLITLGLALMQTALHFSWSNSAQILGERLEHWHDIKRKRHETLEDIHMGLIAAREREVQVLHDRVAESQRKEDMPTFIPTIAPMPPMPPVQPHDPVVPTYTPSHGMDALAATTSALSAPPILPVLPNLPALPTIKPTPISKRVVRESQHALFMDETTRHLPRIDLLDAPLAKQESVSTQTLEMTSRLIEKKLKDFGVAVRVIAAMPGPVVTRYEIEPDTGVKGSQIVGLAKDLARSLSLVSIRVIETIPGKNCMALELPNAKRQMIKLSEILGADEYNDAKSLLTMGLGKDIAGKPVVADLAKMPHCLVAGTTGSGKSVGINAMILSLLYKAEAHEVRLLLIDPKMLEMSIYEGIPHLIAPVVTDMKQAAYGLTWCVAEMERRYKLMSKMGVRNLAGFNTKVTDAKNRGELIPNPFALNNETPEPLEALPHIVIVIDELADLMMVIGKKIEELIARLAQKARAAGIHLVLATQRPSVDVITGLIKANIPTRIAFQVSSKIDSRTILDQMGAEALLGMGDMLYMPSGTGFPTRVHGAFVSDEEVHRVVDYLKSQGEPNYIDGVLEAAEGGDSLDSMMGEAGGGSASEKDALYDQAVEIVLKNRKASISLVQRHLKIGYNRAANMLEAMEKAGLVSNLSSNGQRDILVPARNE